MRIRDAEVLLAAGQHNGSYYLMGYAVECAIKAAIAKKTRRSDFPDRKLANASYTHNLEDLLRVAQLWDTLEADMRSNLALRVNWNTARIWREETRYKLDGSETKARQLYLACTEKPHGLLSWIRAYW